MLCSAVCLASLAYNASSTLAPQVHLMRVCEHHSITSKQPVFALSRCFSKVCLGSICYAEITSARESKRHDETELASYLTDHGRHIRMLGYLPLFVCCCCCCCCGGCCCCCCCCFCARTVFADFRSVMLNNNPSTFNPH